MRDVDYLRYECSYVEFEKLQEWVEKMTAIDRAIGEDQEIEMNTKQRT